MTHDQKETMRAQGAVIALIGLLWAVTSHGAEPQGVFQAYGKLVSGSNTTAARRVVPLPLSGAERTATFPLGQRVQWADVAPDFRGAFTAAFPELVSVGWVSRVADEVASATTSTTTTPTPVTTTSTTPGITNPPPAIRARPQDVWANPDIGSEEFTWIADGKGGSMWTDQPTCNEMQWAQINYGMQAARELRDAGLLAEVQLGVRP